MTTETLQEREVYEKEGIRARTALVMFFGKNCETLIRNLTKDEANEIGRLACEEMGLNMIEEKD